MAADRIKAKGGVGETSNSSLRNQLLNKDLLPDHIYEVDGYIYETDVQGRVKKIEGELRNGPSRRDPIEQTKARSLKNGNPSDDGGHMIGARFNGPVEQINYFPQDLSSNRYGIWKRMEDEWAAKVQSGVKVEVEITPMFVGDSKRPYEFEVKYYYDNVEQTLANNPNFVSPISNP